MKMRISLSPAFGRLFGEKASNTRILTCVSGVTVVQNWLTSRRRRLACDGCLNTVVLRSNHEYMRFGVYHHILAFPSLSTIVLASNLHYECGTGSRSTATKMLYPGPFKRAHPHGHGSPPFSSAFRLGLHMQKTYDFFQGFHKTPSGLLCKVSDGLRPGPVYCALIATKCLWAGRPFPSMARSFV